MKSNFIFNFTLTIVVFINSIVDGLFDSDDKIEKYNIDRLFDSSVVSVEVRMIIGLCVIVSMLFLSTFIIKQLWNKLFPKLFSLVSINYSDAYGLTLLVGFVSGRF